MEQPHRPVAPSPPPVVTSPGCHVATTPRGGHLVAGAGTCALRLRRIEPFDQDASSPSVSRASPRCATMIPARRSLSNMEFQNGVFSTAELLSSSPQAPTDQPSLTHSTHPTHAPPVSSRTAQPGAFLASLRAKTLLDYDFMREFSLAKRKPIEDRNLSKMSQSSLYSMRMAQMELEEQAKRLQRLPFPAARSHGMASSKAEDDTRHATATTAANVANALHSGDGAAAAITTMPRGGIRRLHTMPSPSLTSSKPLQDAAATSSCFPTLWTPGDLATSDTSSKPILTLKYRQRVSEATTITTTLSSSPTPPSHPHTTTTKRQHHHHHKTTTSSSSSSGGPLLHDGLSDFDLRKCHATSLVTAQHGFLSDQDLGSLLKDTGYNRSELYALWVRFKALCAIAKSPKGIDKDTFRRGIPQLSVEDEFFIDRVFDILDADGSGILEWQEFVAALSALEKGDVVQRVTFLFRVYDLNGDGHSIDRKEVRKFFLASLLIETTDELVQVATHFVGKIFEAVGCGDQETMKIDDALQYMRDHPTADIYSLFGRTMVTKPNATTTSMSTDPPSLAGEPSKLARASGSAAASSMR